MRNGLKDCEPVSSVLSLLFRPSRQYQESNEVTWFELTHDDTSRGWKTLVQASEIAAIH